jgi:hypothetical protein
LPSNIDATLISHEGFIGYFGFKFNELKYEKVEKVKRMFFADETETFWSGFSDKYWLTSFILIIRYVNMKYAKQYLRLFL